MKQSKTVSLCIVPALVAACGGSPPPDPCVPANYVAAACQYAVDHQGYYHDGTFYRHTYGYPFGYYTSGYSAFLMGGGRPQPIAAEHFNPTYPAAGAVGGGGAGGVSSGGTVRSGFGASGASNAAGSAGAGTAGS